MAKVKFDVSGEDAEKNSTVRVFETPPVGVYPARIAACNAEEPADKQPRLHVVFEITKPAKNNYPQIHEYINYTDASAWKMDQFLQAVGLATKAKRTGEFEDSKLKGKTLLLYLTHRTEEYNGATQTRARISNMLKKDAVIPPELSAKGGKGISDEALEETTDEEIDLVMHGAAADEGDEESIDFLTEKAGEVELDPDDFGTWAELVTAIEAASEEEEETEEEEEAEDETNLGELVEAADGGDDDAVAELYAYFEANEGTPDPDEYETWAEWLDAAQAALTGEEETEEEEEPDYEAMSTISLKKIARERELPTSGTKEDLIERLQEFDANDPFEE